MNLTERKALAEEIARLDDEAKAVAKEYHGRFKKTESEIKELEEQLKQKKKELCQLRDEHHGKDTQICMRRNECRSGLEKTADDLIDETIRSFDEKAYRLRLCSESSREQKVMGYIISSMEKLKLMKLEAVLDKKKLQKLVSGLSKNWASV